jgi:hypothetical protein
LVVTAVTIIGLAGCLYDMLMDEEFPQQPKPQPSKNPPPADADATTAPATAETETPILL